MVVFIIVKRRDNSAWGHIFRFPFSHSTNDQYTCNNVWFCVHCKPLQLALQLLVLQCFLVQSLISQWQFDGINMFPEILLVPSKIRLMNPKIKFILEIYGETFKIIIAFSFKSLSKNRSSVKYVCKKCFMYSSQLDKTNRATEQFRATYFRIVKTPKGLDGKNILVCSVPCLSF